MNFFFAGFGANMLIRRITSQGPETLEQRYQRAIDTSQQDTERRPAQGMLNLIKELQEDGPDPLVWGLTSIIRLSLHAVDDWKSPALVIIDPTMGGGWRISCVMPRELQPWPEAIISGNTDDLAEAVRRVRLG